MFKHHLQISPTRLRKLLGHSIYGLLTVALVLTSLILSWTIEDGRIVTDLRNRVVGTRVALQGVNPYSYKWQEGDPIEWLDAMDRPENQFSRLTVTPAVLLFHIPLANLEYRIITRIWFVSLWFLYFLSWILITSQVDYSKKLIITMFFAVFAVSPYWLFHLVVGQLYWLYGFLILLLYFSYTHSRKILSSLLVSLLVMLKPSFILFIFFLKFDSRSWRNFVFGLGIILFTTFIFFGPNLWIQYASMLQQYSNANINQLMGTIHPNFVFSSHENVIDIDMAGDILSLPDTSIRYSLVYLGLGYSKLVFQALYLLSILLIVMKKRLYKYPLDSSHFFVFICLITWLGDFFFPIPRYPYYDVITFVFLLIMTTQENIKVSLYFFLLVVITFAGWLFLPWISNLSFVVISFVWLYTFIQPYKNPQVLKLDN